MNNVMERAAACPAISKSYAPTGVKAGRLPQLPPIRGKIPTNPYSRVLHSFNSPCELPKVKPFGARSAGL